MTNSLSVSLSQDEPNSFAYPPTVDGEGGRVPILNEGLDLAVGKVVSGSTKQFPFGKSHDFDRGFSASRCIP